MHVNIFACIIYQFIGFIIISYQRYQNIIYKFLVFASIHVRVDLEFIDVVKDCNIILISLGDLVMTK